MWQVCLRRLIGIHRPYVTTFGAGSRCRQRSKIGGHHHEGHRYIRTVSLEFTALLLGKGHKHVIALVGSFQRLFGVLIVANHCRPKQDRCGHIFTRCTLSLGGFFPNLFQLNQLYLDLFTGEVTVFD